jgi:hypothetical protein
MLGALPPAVAPVVGVVLVPQPASKADAASATNVLMIVRGVARRLGENPIAHAPRITVPLRRRLAARDLAPQGLVQGSASSVHR